MGQDFTISFGPLCDKHDLFRSKEVGYRVPLSIIRKLVLRFDRKDYQGQVHLIDWTLLKSYLVLHPSS